MCNRVKLLVCAVLSALIVEARYSTCAASPSTMYHGGVSMGAVSYGTPAGVGIPMRSTSTMRTSYSSGTSYSGYNSRPNTTNGGYRSGSVTTGKTYRPNAGSVHAVGAASPTRRAAGPRRAPDREGAYFGELWHDGDGDYYWDDEEWVLLSNQEPEGDMNDHTQPIGDIPWVMFLFLAAGYGAVKTIRLRRKQVA